MAKHRKFPGLLLARLLLLVAAGIASYLAWVSLTGGAVGGCGPESGCHAVLNSRWAYWFRAPVSLLALAAYAGILGASFSVGAAQAVPRQNRAWAVMLALGFLVAGAAIWFTGLQVFVLRKFCPFCLTAHACGTIAAIILFQAAPIRGATPGKKKKATEAGPRLAAPQVMRSAWLALGGLAVLIAGQVLYEPPTNVTKSLAGPGSAAPASSPPAAARWLVLHEGQFQLNVQELPLIGRPDAANVIVSLYDYTCEHCRIMHGHLREVQGRFSNDLAIVSLPIPLNPDCNEVVRRSNPIHENACDYARLALALWRVDHAAYHRFDDWLFQPDTPPPLAEAQKFATQLAGSNNLERALADPWITDQLRRDTAIYKADYQKSGTGQIPQLILGVTLSVGEFREVGELYRLVEDKYGLRIPAAAGK